MRHKIQRIKGFTTEVRDLKRIANSQEVTKGSGEGEMPWSNSGGDSSLHKRFPGGGPSPSKGESDDKRKDMPVEGDHQKGVTNRTNLEK